MCRRGSKNRQVVAGIEGPEPPANCSRMVPAVAGGEHPVAVVAKATVAARPGIMDNQDARAVIPEPRTFSATPWRPPVEVLPRSRIPRARCPVFPVKDLAAGSVARKVLCPKALDPRPPPATRHHQGRRSVEQRRHPVKVGREISRLRFPAAGTAGSPAEEERV